MNYEVQNILLATLRFISCSCRNEANAREDMVNKKKFTGYLRQSSASLLRAAVLLGKVGPLFDKDAESVNSIAVSIKDIARIGHPDGRVRISHYTLIARALGDLAELFKRITGKNEISVELRGAALGLNRAQRIHAMQTKMKVW